MDKTVMFDVDGTLIDKAGKPLMAQIKRYTDMQKQGYKMGVWSRAGEKHAKDVMSKFGLKGTTAPKASFKPDIAYDNDEPNMGKETIKVGIPTIRGRL